jgi:long-subunit fatty acid transport protein
MELRMPDSYGLGLAIRLSDRLTIDIDIYRTEWNRYTLVDSSGNKTSPVTGMPKSDTSVKPTHQVRLGGEYLFIRENTVIPVRAGIFYDPEPSEGNPEDYYGVSLGSGFMWGNMVLDAAYQYRWGNDVEGDVIGVPNTSADVSQHLALVSAIYHF